MASSQGPSLLLLLHLPFFFELTEHKLCTADVWSCFPSYLPATEALKSLLKKLSETLVMPLTFSVVLISVTVCITEMESPKHTSCRLSIRLHLCPLPCSLPGKTDEQIPRGPTCPQHHCYTVLSLGERNTPHFSSEKQD